MNIESRGAQAGWKFTILNGDHIVVRVGISNFERAKDFALQRCKSGQITKHKQMSALEVERLSIANTCSITRVISVKGKKDVAPTRN